MAFTDKSPSSWLGGGYSLNTTASSISFNTNDAASNKLLPELTNSEANATTGDIRKLMFGVIDGLFNRLKTKNDGLALADRPENMTINRSSSVGDDGVITRTFSFTFKLSTSGIEVKDE